MEKNNLKLQKSVHLFRFYLKNQLEVEMKAKPKDELWSDGSRWGEKCFLAVKADFIKSKLAYMKECISPAALDAKLLNQTSAGAQTTGWKIQ